MPVVLLQHGGLDNLTGKTGLAMLRHRSGPIVAVIDPAHAGQSLEDITGIVRCVPIVENLQQALLFSPQAAVVGLAPSGGRLPDPLRMDAIAALQAGLHLASTPTARALDLGSSSGAARPAGGAGPCSHASLSPVACSGSRHGCWKDERLSRVVGAAEHCSHPARFVGTGQAGILISGEGVALNAVRVDDAAGPAPRVRAIALNTARLDESDAKKAVERTAAELGLPCSDPVRWGGQTLLQALLNT